MFPPSLHPLWAFFFWGHFWSTISQSEVSTEFSPLPILLFTSPGAWPYPGWKLPHTYNTIGSNRVLRWCHFTFRGGKLETVIWERHHFRRWGESFCLFPQMPWKPILLYFLTTWSWRNWGQEPYSLKSGFLPHFIHVPWMRWYAEASFRFLVLRKQENKSKNHKDSRKILLRLFSLLSSFWNNALNALMCSYIYL